MTSIPKPTFPGPRPRRSSIAQAAEANRGTTEGPATADAANGATEPAVNQTRPPMQSEPPPASTTSDQDQPHVAHESSPTPLRSRTRSATTRAGSSTTATSTSNKRLAQSRDILLSLPDDLKLRMVNTIAWTTPHTGINQQQKFIRKAISDLCDRLEKQFNNGNTFPAPATADD